jgi:hypothetical protein
VETRGKYGFVLLWLLGILAPVGWLVRVSPYTNWLFDLIFGPVWMHWLAHAVIFGVLSFCLVPLLAAQTALSGRRLAGVVLGLALLVALLQEGFQLGFKGYAPGRDELLDVLIDLAGAVVGLAAWYVGERRHSKLKVES